MNITKYEEMIVSKKMKIVSRQKIDDYEIYISDGFSSGDRDERLPHYKTMYAIAYNPEFVRIGEFFTTPITFPYMLRDDRIKETTARAIEMIDNFKETGCLRS